MALALCAPAWAAEPPADPTPKAPHFTPDEVATDGAVTVGGARIEYRAVAGTLVVHPKGWDDAAPPDDPDAKGKAGQGEPAPGMGEGGKNPSAEAAMSYVAYFKHDAEAVTRPLTFLFNGGPGSATVWLHMGAFGPRRVVTADAEHSPAAPYRVVENDESLLDASDLVFIDAPGTGFGRVAGRDKDKAFFGVDADAHAFAEFISAFLSKHHRWSSPKYLFGESYGTLRSAVLVNMLQDERATDFNGVILLSQVLSFDLSPDGPGANPGNDLPYALALPTYAATAWFHHRLDARYADLPALLKEAEGFALADYASALAQGSALEPATRDAVAARLHDYTGLPADYIARSDLRVNGGQFEQHLLADTGRTTGRLDSRFSGPALDPMSREAEYDPQSAAISSAYVAACNDYLRGTLLYGEGKTYRPFIDVDKLWDFKHRPPGADRPLDQTTNGMVDLAHAMKQNPLLRVQLDAGYFDLATPYFQGVYEMRHLPIPPALQANIEYRQYRSGHMVYVNPDGLRQLHDHVADFIARTANVPAAASR